ncbi:MAG: hypothetical protein ACJ75F_12175 [Flavisolibacter sp.]
MKTFFSKTDFMRDKEQKNREPKTNKKTSKRDRKEERSHEFETMSQVQNRYGNGREHNGSDGTSTQGRGSNH